MNYISGVAMYTATINQLKLTIMDKKFEKIYEIAEREGWQVDSYYVDNKTKVCFSFEKYSPAGQDFYFEVSVPNEDDEYNLYYNVADAIETYWEDFDVSYETYIWLDENGHGKNGAPYDMKELYEDMQACQDMIHDLWLALEGKEKPTKTKQKQYVYEVFESDAWHSHDSMRHVATYMSLEEAVDAIMEHGEFDEEENLDYIRERLLDYHQTPETGDVNYEISVVEIGTWNE